MKPFAIRLQRAFLYISAALVVLVAMLFIKMARTSSPHPLPQTGGKIEQSPAKTALQTGETTRLAERLSQAIGIATVSSGSGISSSDALRTLQMHLQASFPLLHATLQRELVSDLALVYVWPGSVQTPQAHRPPYLLLAHQDVVPVEPGSEGKWHKPPFSGAIADGYVWGRGAIDDKASLMAMLEAIERLIRAGFKPQRTLYLAFGHDEERSGHLGAAAISRLFRQRGLHFEFAIDEGQTVTQGIVPGIRQPVALIGLAEKGYLSAELVVNGHGGHSSMPPVHTAIGILSQALSRLEAHQMPARLQGPVEKLFATLAPELPLLQRLVMTNLWLLQPLVLHQLAENVLTAPLVRTTTAVTMFDAGTKDNVLPARARAVVNFRLLPGDSSARVLGQIRDGIDDAPIAVRPLTVHEATHESSDQGPAFELLSRTIQQVFPDALIAPTLNIAAADARHYEDVADNVYRFVPLFLRPSDLPTIHGTDEKIAIADYLRAVVFYENLLRNADGQP